MQKGRPAEKLKESIRTLSLKRIEEEKLLKEQFSATYQSIRPVNILRNMLAEVALPSNFKGDLTNAVSGIISGYVTQRLIIKSSKNPFTRLIGVIVQYGVTNLVTKNSEPIKNLIVHYIKKFTDKLRD